MTFTASFMSNTKWRRAFTCLATEPVPAGRCHWKFTNEVDPVPGYLPDPAQMGATYVGDCGAVNGPVAFELIEWVEFPARVSWQAYEKAPLQWLEQDLAEVRSRLERAGAFELEETDHGLRLVGYRRA